MTDFENNKILAHLKELEDQLESVNQKFKQIELELRVSGGSLEQLYLSHRNRLKLSDHKQINDNLFHQLHKMQHEFSNIQNGVAWFEMQMAVFLATLERAAFFVTSEREALEAKKHREGRLEQEAKFRYSQLQKQQEEQQRLAEMAEKARTYPYPSPSPLHLTPYRTWPY